MKVSPAAMIFLSVGANTVRSFTLYFDILQKRGNYNDKSYEYFL
jgi:hypothetical protein